MATKKSSSKSKDSDIVRIAVTFPRPSDQMGLTKASGRPTGDTLKDFVPDHQTVSQAIGELEKRGFRVTGTSDLSVTLRGTRRNYERAFGTKLIRRKTSTEAGNVPVQSFLATADEAPWNPVSALSSLIDDAYIQWPHIYMNQRFPAGGPSLYPPQVGYHHLRVPGDVVATLNAARVHRQGITGRGVRVAMIDSGFNFSHPHFQEHGYNTSVVLAPDASDSGLDGNGHGTGESANLLGVAPDVTFIGVKLDNEDPTKSGASMLEGFKEAMKHDPQVISVSLGYDLVPHHPITGRRTSNIHFTTLPNGLKALEADIQLAVNAGVVVVFSAGNGHVSFPGMMPEVISAGGVFVAADGAMQASDYSSAFTSKIYAGRQLPDFCGLVGMASNHADYIMLPIQSGCEIDKKNAVHDKTTKKDGWGVFSGTSAAAPQLAGVCALLLEDNPGLTPDEVKNALRRTARDVINGRANAASNEGVAVLATTGTDSATGTGLVDAFAAWQQIQ